jgi:ankyrin repeat protein
MNSASSMCLPVLHISAFFDFETLVESLIKSGMPVDKQDHNKTTALHQVARADSLNPAKVLLRAGATINAQDKTGSPPLFPAISYESYFNHLSGEFLVASALIIAGADVCIKDREGFSTLTLATEIPLRDDGYIHDLVVLLLDHGVTKIINEGRYSMPIGPAIIIGSLRLVQTLIRYGADVDAGPADACNSEVIATPLVKLCDVKNSPAIPLLIEAGASVHAKDCNYNKGQN